MRYEHTQFGYVMVGALMAALVAVAIAAGMTGHVAPIVLVFVILALLWQAATLTVVVDERAFQCWFGPGLIRRRIPLSEIEGVSVMRRAWLWGWGIRLTRGGWLWNVSGLRAVRLQLRGGRHFSVGTDEPERLAEAIEQLRNAASAG